MPLPFEEEDESTIGRNEEEDEFEMENDKVVLLRPLYPLAGGNYLIKLRSTTGETQMKLTVKGEEL